MRKNWCHDEFSCRSLSGTKYCYCGGEIAEVGAKVQGTSWGADAIGIVEKDKVITGNEFVREMFFWRFKKMGFGAMAIHSCGKFSKKFRQKNHW